MFPFTAICFIRAIVFSLLAFSYTTVHAKLVDVIYQLDLSACDPDLRCQDGDLSGTAGVFINSFPATMEMRYQYDTTATPFRIVPNQIADYRMSGVEIRVDDHILSASTEDQLTQSFISVDQSTDEDIFVMGHTGPIQFDFVEGPLVGHSIDADFLPITVFRTSDAEHLANFALPDASLLEGFDSVRHDFDQSYIVFSDGLGRSGWPWAVSGLNIESQSQIDEPSTIALLILGFLGIAYQKCK